ncbi:pre-mRNA-splicing factor 38A-like [Saccostrea echinata]|uniref:pre-mRNA-splicing factor 38A-like n=1 Tax=Saccostrea echinata TaxID=191078 RepID=UPI002A7F6FA7|nr:pre-mRNA-splicing factor 38A-like [Saccostrea echinata]
MANRTVKDAHSVKGTNPQYLVEKIIRTRIYECRYWKEECFALTAELLVDKAMELKYIGGVYGGNVKPSPFLCLVLKMLQIQPEKDIVVEFIRNENFKYVRALGAFYMRLTGTTLDCFKYLEPLYYDYRKLKMQNRDGGFYLIHMDEFIDNLLRDERVCDIILPRIQKRHILEENNELESRVSALDEDLEDMDTDEEEAMERSPSPVDRRHGDRGSPPRHRRSPSPRNRDRDRRKRSRSRDREKRKRSPTDKRHRDEDRKKSKKHRHEHKSRDKDRDREKRHHRSSRHHKDDKDRDREKDKGGSRSESKAELSVAETNELRASLGLPPLK